MGLIGIREFGAWACKASARYLEEHARHAVAARRTWTRPLPREEYDHLHRLLTRALDIANKRDQSRDVVWDVLIEIEPKKEMLESHIASMEKLAADPSALSTKELAKLEAFIAFLVQLRKKGELEEETYYKNKRL